MLKTLLLSMHIVLAPPVPDPCADAKATIALVISARAAGLQASEFYLPATDKSPDEFMTYASALLSLWHLGDDQLKEIVENNCPED